MRFDRGIMAAGAEECLAAEFLSSCGHDCMPVDAFALARSVGIPVCFGSIPHTDMQVIYVPRRLSYQRQQWLVAHELGHILLGRARMIDSEAGADLVALSLLLPRDPFLRDIYELGCVPERLASRHPACSHYVISRRIADLGVSSGLFAPVTVSAP